MKTRAVPPFLLPPSDAVEPGPWRSAGGEELPPILEHWDPFTKIEASRTISVNVDAVRDACDLGEDACLAIAVTWYGSTTRLSGGPPPTELSDLPGHLRVALEVSVPGSHVGGRVELRTRLVLRHPGRSQSPISPRVPGTILWRDETSVTLEGSAARFPVAAMDFAETRYPSAAPWALDWSPDDLGLPVLGGMRLLVNAAHTQLMELLRQGNTEPRSASAKSFIMYDVARTLITGALLDEQFVASSDAYEEGTLGRMIADLISACWSPTPIPVLAQMLAEDPARLDAELKAHLEVSP